MAIRNTDPAATPKLSANFGCPRLFKSFPHRLAASKVYPNQVQRRGTQTSKYCQGDRNSNNVFSVIKETQGVLKEGQPENFSKEFVLL